MNRRTTRGKKRNGNARRPALPHEVRVIYADVNTSRRSIERNRTVTGLHPVHRPSPLIAVLMGTFGSLH